jgi:hypothetical protein
MPRTNAVQVRALLSAGVLRLVAGGAATDMTGGLHLQAARESDRAGSHGHTVVNALGVPRGMPAGDAWASLLRQGLVCPHPLGGVRLDPRTRAVIDGSGRPVPNLAVVGPPTTGENIGSSGIRASVTDVEAIVSAWLPQTHVITP